MDGAARAVAVEMQGRHARILDRVHRKGFVSIEELAQDFGVSAQTIRRDIKELARQRLLRRYHGGAGLPEGADRLAYGNRKIRNAAEKRAIARLVAAQIPNGASLFIDIGTTMEAVAEALLQHEKLRVITNHMDVASLLSERTDFEIIVAGGMVRNRDRAITGEAASEFLRKFRVGYGIFGIGVIDEDGEMLDYDYRDVQVSITAMSITRRRFVALDHSKFGGDAMVRVCHVSEVDAVFTDAPPPARLERLLREQGVALFLPDAAAERSAGSPTVAPIANFDN
jgi:DeoR family glycerol-3-phosphate regulon repressor